MLHYLGDAMAMELGHAAKRYLQLYAKKGADTAFVPFVDIDKGKKRYVKFMWLNEQWVYVDIVDK